MSNRTISRPAAGMRRAPVSTHVQRPPQRRIGIGRLGHYLTRPFLASGTMLFSLAVIVLLYASWANRDEGHLTPENGTGYWLGITGSVMMFVLLLYPLRKRLRIFRNFGKTPSWFQWHMIIGIIGPALVLVHSNWKFASLNATVATVVMLTVVVSGIIGRYLYTKVHMGFYGRKAELYQIMADASMLKAVLGDDVPQTTHLSLSNNKHPRLPIGCLLECRFVLKVVFARAVIY